MTKLDPVPDPDIIPGYLEVCPEFKDRWDEHRRYWGNEPAGAYNDLAVLAQFIVDAYEDSNIDIVTRILNRAEQLLEKNDAKISELITIGLIEDIQTIASHKTFGNQVFKEFLGPLSKVAWQEIEKIWKGKSSLMEVVRAERKQNGT